MVILNFALLYSWLFESFPKPYSGPISHLAYQPLILWVILGLKVRVSIRVIYIYMGSSSVLVLVRGNQRSKLK